LLREIDGAKAHEGVSLWFLGQLGFVIKINSVNPARFTDEMYRACPQKKSHIFALGEHFHYCKETSST